MDLIKTLTPPPARPLRKRVGAYDRAYPLIPRRTMVVMFVIVVFVVYGTFRTIPTVGSYGVLRGFSTITGLSC